MAYTKASELMFLLFLKEDPSAECGREANLAFSYLLQAGSKKETRNKCAPLMLPSSRSDEVLRKPCTQVSFVV